MADTFGSLWKRLLVYAPDLPLPLAQEFVSTAYERALADHAWSALQGESEFQIAADLDINGATVTNGSATVLTVQAAAAHVGRQFIFITNGPNTTTPLDYTIVAATPGVSYTLDRVWSGVNEAGQGTVVDRYKVVPTDFLAFVSVVDLEAQWKLRFGATLQEDLDRWDPKRTTTSSSPRVVVPASPQPAAITATAGLPRYEFWPRPTTVKTLPFRYIKNPATLSAASDTLINPIRGDVIRHGALAELAMWPGTAERKNPFYNLDLHRTHEELFKVGLSECAIDDQNIAQTAVRYAEADFPFAPLDAEFLQAHA